MARYIKANQKVAAYLHLENDRLRLKDGNYILWQGDRIWSIAHAQCNINADWRHCPHAT